MSDESTAKAPFAVKASVNSHWYSRSGVPTYEVPYAASNKAKAGQFRPTSLKDAREMDLLPSVTNCLDVKEKPQLTAWKITNAIIAALTTPQNEGELLDDFAARVAQEAASVAGQAANFGTRVHQSIEDFLVNDERTEDPEITEFFENWLVWASQNLDMDGIHFSERVVVGDGYAGRADLKCRALLGSSFAAALIAAGHNPEDFGIIDFKTRVWTVYPPGGKKESKAPTYDEDGAQLAAYVSADIAMASESDEVEPASWAASVFIHSRDPQAATDFHVWTPNEMARGWKLFRACLELWAVDRGYDPRES